MDRLTHKITDVARRDYQRYMESRLGNFTLPHDKFTLGEYTTGDYMWMFGGLDEGKAVQRLAEYENTGLTPEEIMRIQELREYSKSLCKRCCNRIKVLFDRRAYDA